MAKSELGTKRIDPETGRKFYDLNHDPIVSPYTGKSYPRSYFDSGADTSIDKEALKVTLERHDSIEVLKVDVALPDGGLRRG